MTSLIAWSRVSSFRKAPPPGTEDRSFPGPSRQVGASGELSRSVVGELADLSYAPWSPRIVRLAQASTASAASLDHDAQPSRAP